MLKVLKWLGQAILGVLFAGLMFLTPFGWLWLLIIAFVLTGNLLFARKVVD